MFYFANLSAITPPVAVAALVGANIAKANFWGSSFSAVRLALPGFLLPFLFLFKPEILGLAGSIGGQFLAIAQVLIATAALNFALEARIFKRVSIIERLILALAALGLLYWDPWVETISLSIILVISVWNWSMNKRARHNLENGT